MELIKHLIFMMEGLSSLASLLLYYLCVFLLFCAPFAIVILGAISLNNYIVARRKHKFNPTPETEKKMRKNLVLFIICAVIAVVVVLVMVAFVCMFFMSLAYM